MPVCPNCRKKGSHFVPPSLGEEGFFICIREKIKKAGHLLVWFSWKIEPKVRHKIEKILTSSGYVVHGGGTNFVNNSADIALHKK